MENIIALYNLVNVKVSQGQDVSTGQLIGNVYTDSESGESLLYFQIWKDIEPNNPEDWLSN
jgi:septal ring factor EnvC (AmiA/AmiB activator)